MRLLYIIAILVWIGQVVCYLGERQAPLSVMIENKTVKRGDTISIRWQLAPGVQFPLYGYASARTAKTDLGLLPLHSERTQSYLYPISHNVAIRDYAYEWTIGQDVPLGTFQIGLGFFYHETSMEIEIME